MFFLPLYQAFAHVDHQATRLHVVVDRTHFCVRSVLDNHRKMLGPAAAWVAKGISPSASDLIAEPAQPFFSLQSFSLGAPTMKGLPVL
jgi:hypothetical protein